MGITLQSFNLEKNLFESLGISYKDLELCELGNQRLAFRKQTGKEYYSSLGVKHTSIDLNGKDGALPLNLDTELPKAFLNKFNVVTDYGTIEHVNNQYQVFKNVHNLCIAGGIMIHVLPSIDSSKSNERYYYSKEFMEELAKKCGYKLLQLSIYRDPPTSKSEAIRAVFIKTNKSQFLTKTDFYKIKGVKDSGDLRYTGNYERKLSTWIRWYLRILRNPKNIKMKLSRMFSHS